jgi:hypothetical protein
MAAKFLPISFTPTEEVVLRISFLALSLALVLLMVVVVLVSGEFHLSSGLIAET